MTQSTPQTTTITITPAQRRFASFMTDVLIYTVVLNLFVEHVDAIVIDSFGISILTAVLLKILLDLITGIEHRVANYFKQRSGTLNKVLGYVSVFLILSLSKFVILEVVDLVFGDHVELGHFVEIVALIVAMIAARLIFQKIYESLGEPEPAAEREQ